METTNLEPDCGANTYRWNRILWKDSAKKAEAAGPLSLEGNTRQGYSQYDSVVPTVWQVLYILTSVSLTVKSKQSCGSVLIFLQCLLPVSKSVEGADTSGISPKSVTAGIQTSLALVSLAFVKKKKKRIKEKQNNITPNLGMCHMALWQALKRAFCFLMFFLQ